MDERIVDARGLSCPKPLILTKEALNEAAAGQAFQVLLDNDTSCRNVERFLADQRMPPVVEEGAGQYTLRFMKKSGETSVPGHEMIAANRHVIVIRSDRMGCGPEELGQILMKAFLNTIGEVSPLPSALILYNQGVHLARQGSASVEALRTLHSRGVPILVCGTCVDYFQVKADLGVGTLSNMLTILETLTSADKIVSP